jgi:predicted metal-dependent phosphotriesterase family hydrolase
MTSYTMKSWQLGQLSFNFIARKVLPYLGSIGLSAQAVAAITADNPRRYFGGQ